MVVRSITQRLIFWFSCLSSTGNAALAENGHEQLNKQNIKTSILDIDDALNSLHKHLGFSETKVKVKNTLIVELYA